MSARRHDPHDVRLLSDLSGRVVGAVLDDGEGAAVDSDAFSDALRRYREQGAPEHPSPWRRALPVAHAGRRAADVLRRLARDLLKDVSMAPEPADATASAPAEEAPPPNVRPIADSREVPALELASDGTWRPSGSSLAAQEEADTGALRRSVPSVRSRYPRVERGTHVVLPPAPPRP